MALIKGCVHALLILYGSLGYLTTAFPSNSTDTQYVHLLNKVKTPVLAEIDLSKLGEQLKSFMKIEIEKVITKRIALESTNIYHQLENNLNSAIKNFTTSMDAYTNASINLRRNIARKLNQTLARRVRRFRIIMHFDILSYLQNVKREIDYVLRVSFNKSNEYNQDRRKLRQFSGKIKRMSKHMKDQSCNRNGSNKKFKKTESPSNTYGKDHKGKLFFIMFPIHLEDYMFAQFIITTDRQTKVDLLSEYADINRTVVITTGVAYIDIPSSLLMLGIGRTYTTVLIRSDQLITVVGFFGMRHCFRHEGCGTSSLIILPATALGKNYSLITLQDYIQNCGIIATDTNTTVVIESASLSISVGSATIQPGKQFKTVLDYLEGFHIQTENSLTATKISANKPIVVISGNKYSYLKDSSYESMIPVDKWSRHFIIPLINMALSYRIIIVSRNKNATITIQDNLGVSITEHGDLIIVDLSVKAYYVYASNPIFLSLYTDTEYKGINMMIVPGIEHFSRDYIIAPPVDPFYESYLSIIIKSSDVDGLRFVGNLLDVESTVIMARNESFTVVVKRMGGLSVFKIRHLSTNAFYGVIVYGIGDFRAYGYPAGFRF